ncbi:MAG: aminotransferase class V-fold PLP-dependent enzyme [Geminicoccaceae bacterium]
MPSSSPTGRRAAAHITALALPGVAAATQVMALDLAGVAVSAGAACSSGKVATSHVLAAMGMAPALAASTIRVSLGWTTTASDIERSDAWGSLPGAGAGTHSRGDPGCVALPRSRS